MKRFVVLLALVLLSGFCFAQSFQIADFNLLGMTKSQFVAYTKATENPTTGEVMNISIPHTDYTMFSATKNGRIVRTAVAYDEKGLSKIVIEESLALEQDEGGTMEFLATVMAYQRIFTALGKDPNGGLYFRAREGVVIIFKTTDGMMTIIDTHQAASEMGVK